MMTFIKSGEWIVRNQDYVIRTDLGSCVALCLWDATRKLGGMNHYLLPGKESEASVNPSNGHYANQSLIYEMIRNGASLYALQGAIVGGGRLCFAGDIFGIGEGNVTAAEFILDKYNIPTVFRRVGGNVSRSVELNVDSGQLQVKEIQLGTGDVRQYQHTFDKR